MAFFKSVWFEKLIKLDVLLAEVFKFPVLEVKATYPANLKLAAVAKLVSNSVAVAGNAEVEELYKR
jgi:hypothetical protein